MNERKIKCEYGIVEVVGKHIKVRIEGVKDPLDEYDMLSIAADQDDYKASKLIIKFLDAVVPIENETYFDLRCEVLQNIVMWRIQQRYAIDPNKIKTYLMTDGDTGATKIGRSINPPKREHTLQSEKRSISLRMVCDKDVEKELHREYKNKRIRGEWFNLSERNIKDIAEAYGFKPV